MSAIGRMDAPAFERRVAEHELQVLEADEEQAELGEELQRERERPGREAAAGEEARIEHRLAPAQLEDHEGDQQDGADREPRQHVGVEPAADRRLDDPCDEAEQPQRREGGAHGVEGRVPAPRRRHDPGRRGRRDHRERHVDREHGRPREPLEQRPREEQPDDRPGARDAGPDADGAAALVLRKDVRDDGEGGRHDERRADADHGSQRDQPARVADEDGGQRRDAEDGQADLEDALAAEAVAERARRKQEAGEDERVRVHDPLQLALRRAGAAGQVGERHVQRRDRRDDHHQGEAHHGQDGAPGARREELLRVFVHGLQ
jgi:hypothetical protein